MLRLIPKINYEEAFTPQNGLIKKHPSFIGKCERVIGGKPARDKREYKKKHCAVIPITH